MASLKRRRSSEGDVDTRPPGPPRGPAPERPSLRQLMGCQQPRVVKANEATSAMARDAMALLCRTPASDAPLEWRVHPYPESAEGAEGARRSVRESECAYVTATIGEFLEWEATSSPPSSAAAPAGLAPEHPFASVPRDQFWAYADYKDVRDVFR